MRKLFALALAFLAFNVMAYTPRGTLKVWGCTDQSATISVNDAGAAFGTCTIGHTCLLQWNFPHDPTARLDFAYFHENDAQPISAASTTALPITSCTENGGPYNLPGYNCLRMKAHGTGSSGGPGMGCPPAGCDYYLYETTADNENLFLKGSRYTGSAYETWPSASTGYYTFVVDQSPTGWMDIEATFSCDSGGVAWSFTKDFLVKVLPATLAAPKAVPEAKKGYKPGR